MIHFIYCTTCKINGKMYLGKHSTNRIDDGYLGSGIILKNAIAKYGRESFSREILEYAESSETLDELEKQYIDNDIINNPNYYNLALGGKGGCIVLKEGHPLYESTISKRKVAALKNRDKISATVKEAHKQKRCGMYGRKQSQHQKDTVSKAQKGRKKKPEHIAKQKESF